MGQLLLLTGLQARTWVWKWNQTSSSANHPTANMKPDQKLPQPMPMHHIYIYIYLYQLPWNQPLAMPECTIYIYINCHGTKAISHARSNAPVYQLPWNQSHARMHHNISSAMSQPCTKAKGKHAHHWSRARRTNQAHPTPPFFKLPPRRKPFLMFLRAMNLKLERRDKPKVLTQHPEQRLSMPDLQSFTKLHRSHLHAWDGPSPCVT